MNRRQFNSKSMSAVAALVCGVYGHAQALSLADLSNADASKGLKTALEKGAQAAVAVLGKPDGFLGNAQVRIPLPGYLQDAAGILRTLGQGALLDELITSMNRAAEAAIPLAQGVLTQAVQSMSVSDAKTILSGGSTAVTDFFAEKTRTPLGAKFLPMVQKTTQKVGLAAKYNQVAGKAAGVGLVKPEDATIEQYVTTKSLDGLYFMIAEEEKKIRQNPVGYSSAILSKVFGALK